MQANFKQKMNLNREKCIAFGKDPDKIIEKLEPIDKNLSNRILKRFNREKDRNNFISTLTELKFIRVFNELNFTIEYEKTYKSENQDKTPDLTLDFKGNKLIGEIYRLGSSQKDDTIIQFIDKIIDILSEIESDNALFIKFKNDKINFNEFDFTPLKERIENWIKTKPEIHSTLNYNEDIDFEIIYKGKWKTTQLLSDTIFLNIKSEKLSQSENLSNNEITRKILKYSDIVKQEEIPYILCVETDLNAGFHFSDFSERFHHSETEVLDFEKYKDIWLKNGKGKCWSILGDFYKYPFLSGLLILLNNEYKLLLSPLRNQIIYEKRYEEIFKMLTKKFASI
ncbi:hypothetical protein BC962_3262 [Gillisia mitskevichiae]|uniref:Uncharacterized protein n=1 Tax=Gillisia mitskevichiae TaxID=270921 RepID=A0A495NVS2_9FLAO|nr:hypothetical protein [Gillisia mitskevichiae]RKS42504.1 hypothetical protein BC962_3262 [Gillisia mitskevichiae]